jgi:hypothetical protein
MEANQVTGSMLLGALASLATASHTFTLALALLQSGVQVTIVAFR